MDATPEEEKHGITISVPWNRYLYDEEWNRQQLEAHLEGCKRIGEQAAARFDEVFWAAFFSDCEVNPTIVIPPPHA
jgi:hypothetical protein